MSVCARRRLTLAQTQHVHVSGRGRDHVDLGPHGEEAAVELPNVRARDAGHQVQCGRVAACGGGELRLGAQQGRLINTFWWGVWMQRRCGGV